MKRKARKDRKAPQEFDSVHSLTRRKEIKENEDEPATTSSVCGDLIHAKKE